MRKRGVRIKVAAPADRTWNGKTYASKAEMQFAVHLHAMHAAGEFRMILEQPPIRLGLPENTYRPDFMTVARNGDVEFIDVKGQETQAFRKIMQLWREYGPGNLRVIRKAGGRMGGWTTLYVLSGGGKIVRIDN